MVFVVIQIPCYNEEETLGVTLDDLPRTLPGVDRVEWQIIDDGCTDRTVEIARAHGVDHVISLKRNMGLAEGYMAGMNHALRLGADIVVNTDADNQYSAKDIPKLIQPILDGRADIVVGARPIMNIGDFSPLKKRLQRFGSWVVRRVSGAAVDDAPSGFRAVTRAAARRMVVFNHYTYTLETLIQAGLQHLRIVSVPINVNHVARPSRLVKSIRDYVLRSAFTIFRVYAIYRPLRFFSVLGAAVALPGVLAVLRFLYYFLLNDGAGRIQSLVLGTSLVAIGVIMLVAGVLADLIAANRRLLEDIRLQVLDIKEMAEAEARRASEPGE